MSTVTETAQNLIDPAEFAGRIHIDGQWVAGRGECYEASAARTVPPLTDETVDADEIQHFRDAR